jgi:hypothetical protein
MIAQDYGRLTCLNFEYAVCMLANIYLLFTVNLNFATVGTSMSQPLPKMWYWQK